MVEYRTAPSGGGVARGARRRKSSGHVVRIGDTCEISLVARVTVGWRTGVLPAYMTARALHVDVRPSQRKCRLVVIEIRGRPGGGAVTHFAGLRESRSHVIRVRRVVEVLQVAR